MLKFTLTVNGDKKALKLSKALKKFNNLEAPTKKVNKLIHQNFQLNFDKTMGPDGLWKKSKRVLRDGGLTLTLTRELRNSLKSEFTFSPSKALIEVSSSLFWAIVHNQKDDSRWGGRINMPERKFTHLSQEFKDKIAKIYKEAAKVNASS